MWELLRFASVCVTLTVLRNSGHPLGSLPRNQDVADAFLIILWL